MGRVDERLGVGRPTIVQDVPVGSPDLEIGGTGETGFVVRYNSAHLVFFGAIGHSVGTIDSGPCFEKPFPVQAETVANADAAIIIGRAVGSGNG